MSTRTDYIFAIVMVSVWVAAGILNAVVATIAASHGSAVGLLNVALVILAAWYVYKNITIIRNYRKVSR